MAGTADVVVVRLAAKFLLVLLWEIVAECRYGMSEQIYGWR